MASPLAQPVGLAFGEVAVAGVRYSRRYVPRKLPTRRDPIIRSAVFALVTYALGLIPFFFLTPVHRTLPVVLGLAPTVGHVTTSPTPPTRPGSSAAPAAVATPRDGADTVSVPGPSPARKPGRGATPTSVANDSRYAFLLMGYGGGGHDGAYLTDSLMLVIVDPERKTLTLLSLPRDLWVPMSFDGSTMIYNKVNTAYAFAQDSTLYPDRLPRYTGDQGPGTFTAETVSRLLGVPIRYYLGLDFAGFRAMIDAIGGIDVDVPDGFAARYPANDNPAIDPSWKVVRFVKGEQHLDGERAIEYARARETIDNSNEGSDFARSRRQRLIMEAFKRRLFQPGGLIHIPQLLSIASQHVDTNYNVPGVAALSQLVLNWQSVKIYQAALTADNFLAPATGPECTFVLTPAAEGHGWESIQQFVRRLWTDPARGVTVANTQIVVENDSGVPGAAGRMTRVLASLGYQVGAPITGPVQPTSRIIDHSAKGDPALAQQLTKDLGFADLETVADPQGAGDFLVIQVGSDDANLHGLQPLEAVNPLSSAPGILRFGAWLPSLCEPTPTPRPLATPVSVHGSPTPSHHGTPAPGGTEEPQKTETPAPSKTSVLHPTSTPVPRPSPTSGRPHKAR